MHELREQFQKSEDHRTEALQEAASAKAAVQAAAAVSDAVVETEVAEAPSQALSTRHALDEAALEAAQDEIAQLKAVVKQIEGTRSQMRDERARALNDVEKARRACAEKDAQFAAERAGAKASLDEVQRLRALNELDCSGTSSKPSRERETKAPRLSRSSWLKNRRRSSKRRPPRTPRRRGRGGWNEHWRPETRRWPRPI